MQQPQPFVDHKSLLCGIHVFSVDFRQIEKLRRCELISEAEVKTLCAKAREILAEESNVQQLDSPVTVRLSYGYVTAFAQVVAHLRVYGTAMVISWFTQKMAGGVVFHPFSS